MYKNRFITYLPITIESKLYGAKIMMILQSQRWLTNIPPPSNLI